MQSHASRLTAGLPGRGRAAWRRCSTCDKWVIAAFVDGLVATLTPKELDRPAAIAAMQAGTLVYRLRGGIPGLMTGAVIWQSPAWLAVEMRATGGMPANIYAAHPHTGVKDPQPGERRVKPPTAKDDGPVPF